MVDDAGPDGDAGFGGSELGFFEGGEEAGRVHLGELVMRESVGGLAAAAFIFLVVISDDD